MRCRKRLGQQGCGGGDSGEDLLIVQEQAQVLSLKRVDQRRHGVCVQLDQLPCGGIPLRGIRKLGDESFCFTVRATCKPVHIFIVS